MTMLARTASMLSSSDTPVTPTADGFVAVLDQAGIWRYGNSGIAAVGAKTRTLGDVVVPRVVVRGGEPPDGVLLTLSDIVADGRLNWAIQEGTRLDGGEEPQFFVNWPRWQEHAAEPVGAWLPERDAEGIDRCLAMIERRWRFAKKALDDIGRDRMWVILLASRVGKSRREVGETLGLSAGRVQQLNEHPPAELLDELDRFTEDATRIVAALGPNACPREDLPTPRGLGSDRFDEVVAEMIVLGLLDSAGHAVQVTNDGHALATTGLGRPGLSRTNRKPGRSGERVGDAAD
jgi:hypothetical protein